MHKTVAIFYFTLFHSVKLKQCKKYHVYGNFKYHIRAKFSKCTIYVDCEISTILQKKFPHFEEILLCCTEQKAVQDLILAVSDPIREKNGNYAPLNLVLCGSSTGE